MDSGVGLRRRTLASDSGVLRGVRGGSGAKAPPLAARPTLTYAYTLTLTYAYTLTLTYAYTLTLTYAYTLTYCDPYKRNT